MLPNTEYTYTAFIRQMIFYLNPEALDHIMELALPIALDEGIFESSLSFIFLIIILLLPLS